MESFNLDKNSEIREMGASGRPGDAESWEEKGESTFHDQLDEGKGFIETTSSGEGCRMHMCYGLENVTVELGELGSPEIAELHDLALGLAALKASELRVASKSTLEYIADTIHSAAAARHAH